MHRGALLFFCLLFFSSWLRCSLSCETTCTLLESPCDCSCGDWAECCCGSPRDFWSTPPGAGDNAPLVQVTLTITPDNGNNTTPTPDSVQDVANRLLTRYNAGLLDLGWFLITVVDVNREASESSSSSSVSTADGSVSNDSTDSVTGDGDGEVDGSAGVPLFNFMSMMTVAAEAEEREERQTNNAVLNDQGEAVFRFVFNTWVKGFDTRLVGVLLIPIIQITDGGLNRSRLQWDTPTQTQGPTDVMAISGQVLTGVGSPEPGVLVYVSFNATSLTGPSDEAIAGPPFSIQVTTIRETGLFLVFFKATGLSGLITINARFSPIGTTDQEFVGSYALSGDQLRIVQVQMLPPP